MKNMKNIFAAIPEDIPCEIFEPIISSEHIIIERIISNGHSSPETGWYDQEKNEWVLVLKGSAVLMFEDESTLELSAGDYTSLPARQKHKVTWTAPDTETIWLAVHY